MEFEGQVVVYRDGEDGRYNVMVPALPGCVTFGDTREETIAHIHDAISLFLEVAQHDGDPIPGDTATTEIVKVRGVTDPTTITFPQPAAR